MAKNPLPKLVTKATLFIYINFIKKIIGQGAVRGKEYTWFISNEDMDDKIKIISSLENSINWWC